MDGYRNHAEAWILQDSLGRQDESPLFLVTSEKKYCDDEQRAPAHSTIDHMRNSGIPQQNFVKMDHSNVRRFRPAYPRGHQLGKHCPGLLCIAQGVLTHEWSQNHQC